MAHARDCKRSGRINVDIREEPEYGYGGWTGNKEITGFTVYCAECGREIGNVGLWEAATLIEKEWSDQ